MGELSPRGVSSLGLCLRPLAVPTMVAPQRPGLGRYSCHDEPPTAPTTRRPSILRAGVDRRTEGEAGDRPQDLQLLCLDHGDRAFGVVLQGRFGMPEDGSSVPSSGRLAEPRRQFPPMEGTAGVGQWYDSRGRDPVRGVASATDRRVIAARAVTVPAVPPAATRQGPAKETVAHNGDRATLQCARFFGPRLKNHIQLGAP